MTVEILTPEKKVFTGEATGVQMPGVDGLFETLNNHAPLISALGAGKLRVNTAEGAKRFDITGGFVEILNNKAVILLEGATEL